MERFVKTRLDKELLGKERDLTAGQMMRLEAVIFIINVIITMIIICIVIIIIIIMEGGGSSASGKVPVDPTKRGACAPRQ